MTGGLHILVDGVLRRISEESIQTAEAAITLCDEYVSSIENDGQKANQLAESLGLTLLPGSFVEYFVKYFDLFEDCSGYWSFDKSIIQFILQEMGSDIGDFECISKGMGLTGLNHVIEKWLLEMGVGLISPDNSNKLYMCRPVRAAFQSLANN